MDTKLFSLFAASFNTLYDLSSKQFSEHKGLKLDSADWKPHINLGIANFLNFIRTGEIYTSTHTDTSDKKYQQIIQFTKYKNLDNILLLLFLAGVSDQDAISFISTFLFNTRTKVYCNCPAFSFWGFEYILTRKGSAYGEGEKRYPIERNPDLKGVFCKHLWVITSSLHKKQDILASKMLPFYKKAFRIIDKAKFEKYAKELGRNGIQEVLEAAIEDVEEVKNAKIKKLFTSLYSKYDLGSLTKDYKNRNR